MTSAENPNGFVLTKFYYEVDYGKNKPPPGCCRRFSVLYERYRQGRLKLEICRKEWPIEVFEGEAEASTAHELDRLAQGLNPRRRRGQVPGRDYDSRQLADWTLNLLYSTSTGRDAPERTVILHGKKEDKPDPAHLAFAQDVSRYALEKLQALRASRPRHVQSLKCMVVTPEGPCHWRLVDYEDGTRALLQRRQGQREEEVYVHPELVSRITALLLQKYRAGDWHGFMSPGWTDMTPRACAFALTYNTKQQLLVRGIAGKADCVPPGFNPAMRELLAGLHEAMYSPASHVPPWNRPHGLTAFRYRGDSVGGGTEYSTYWRLAPEGKVLRLVRYVYYVLPLDKDECTMRVEDVEKLEALLAETGLLSWDGFDEREGSVVDGFSFTLEIAFADGRTLKAHGYEKFPGGYEAFAAGRNRVLDFLDSLLPYRRDSVNFMNLMLSRHGAAFLDSLLPGKRPKH